MILELIGQNLQMGNESLLVRYVRLALYLWTATLVVQLPTEAILGFRLALSDIALAFIVLGLLWLLCRRRIAWRSTTLDPYLIGLLAIFALSTGIAFVRLKHLPGYTLVNKDLGLVVMLASFYATVFLLSAPELLKRFLKVLLISAFAVNLVTLLAYGAWQLWGIDGPLVHGKRVVGLLIDPNAYGGYLVVVLLFQLSLLLAKEKLLPPAFMVVNAALLLLGTLLTLSRSAWLALVVGAIAWVWLNRGRLKTLYLAMGSGIVMAGLLILLLLWGEHFISQALRERTVLQRLDQARLGLALFAKAPLWGIGLGTFPHFHPAGSIIHNTYIWLLVETGLLGFAAFAGLAGRAVWNYLTALRTGQNGWSWAGAALPPFVAMLALAIGIEALYQRHLWLLLALSEVLRRQAASAREAALQ